MRPNDQMNVLAQHMRQGMSQQPTNALAMAGGRGGGMMQPMPGAMHGGAVPPFQMRQPDPSMPTQEQLDELWARQPTDQTGAMIEDLIRRSGGQLQAPWDRMDPRQPGRGSRLDDGLIRLAGGPAVGGEIARNDRWMRDLPNEGHDLTDQMRAQALAAGERPPTHRDFNSPPGQYRHEGAIPRPFHRRGGSPWYPDF